MDQAASVKIVLVEDDQFISKAYTHGLTRAGFVITAVTDGDEAVSKIRSVQPELVLLDLILPGKDGFNILEEVRADQQLRSIPVVILSNLGQESDVQKAKQLGATDYLVKSDVSMKEVIEKVREHLAKN